MPVAIRKRSWEEHVTHSSGSQYSYDDLDLICCRHGVAAEGLWVGVEASKQGRRTRCASMPEGRRQHPASELAQAVEATASVSNDGTAPKEPRLMKSSVKVPKNLEEESVFAPLDSLEANVFRGDSQEDHLRAGNSGNVANIFCNDARGNDILKSRHIAGEEPQCATILSNNGLPLSALAADRSGDRPDDQEGTKESHVAGHSGHVETSDCLPNQPSTDTPQPQADLLHVEGKTEISASCAEDKCETSPVVMDVCGKMLRSCEALEDLKVPQVELSRSGTEGWTSDCAEVLEGVNGLESENARLDLREEGQNHLGEQDDVTAGEECGQVERSKDAADVGCGPNVSSDECFKGQRCSLTVKEADSADVEGNHVKSNVSHCADQHLEMTASPPREGGDDKGSASQILGLPPSDQTAAQQLENSGAKLDTIPEVSHMQPDDVPVPDPPESRSLTPDPDAGHVHVDDEHAAESARHSADVCPVLPPQGLHSNHEEAACCPGESPGSEVADGQREHGRAASTSSPAMETEAAKSDPGEQRESGGVRMRLRKREHARLDSMVLLLMKLDQLDQEIENALSATSSKDSTPTLQRRQLLDFDSGSTTVAPQHPSNQRTSGAATSSGAKPKSSSSSDVSEREKAEIEAKEACTWLRAAGFPQYAQLYEDAQFPIDISSVTRDHDFLNRDAIEALCRRLNTLNKCALMRLEISPQRKRSEDSDEDEPCAISGRWTFQRDSKRWSRMDELDVFSNLSPADGANASLLLKEQASQKAAPALREGNSSESVLTDLSEQPEVGSIHSGGSGGRAVEEEKNGRMAAPTNRAAPTGDAVRTGSVASVCSSSGTGGSGCANEDSLSDGMPPSPLETLGRFTFDVRVGRGERGGSLDRGGGGGGKSTRSRAKSFLKRMESLRLRSGSASKRKKKVGGGGGGRVEISGPVIKEGLDDDKLKRLNCVDIPNLNRNLNLNQSRIPIQTMTLNRNRSVSYSTQTSSGSSSGSSQSEASGGSAVSTPSPVTRARSHSTAAGGSSKRGGMYLEGFDPFSISQLTAAPPGSAPPRLTVDEQNHRNNRSVPDDGRQQEEEEEAGQEEEEESMIFFYLPEGHKPGTFPKALQDGGSRVNGGGGSRADNGNSVVLRGRHSRRRRHGSSGSVDSRLSFYDNVPHTEREEEDDEGDERKLEQVLQHVSGLQRFVNAWSQAVAGEEEEEDEDEEEEEEEGDSDSALDSASPCPSSPLQNQLEETENGSDRDSTGNPLGEGEDGMRERRDSGVGASLTRSSRPQKLRWPSFQNSHRPSSASAQLQIGCQSVLQMNLLQKLSMLQLTALLEKHTPTNKHGFSWAVPKFIKRIKGRDYKDRNVFGVPLQVIVQRTGQPLPQGIQQAMRYLRNHCLDQVGLFRKSGVKSRIQALRQMNEASGADGGGVNYEGQSAYDVADMLKQYFRDLPEPLLTSKLSETFLQIYQYIPKELRLQAVRAAVLLLPDENREALRTLLCLLSDVTASVAENQMTPTNLAVCLAPSLFHLNTLRRKESSSPRVMNRKPTLGKPDQRDLNENLAATHGLAHMLQECRKLFRIPEEMSRCRNSYVEQALLPRHLEDLAGGDAGGGGYRSLLQDSLDALLKEAKDKFKGYDSCSTPEHVELSCRKVHDGFPLRLWKATVEVAASPEEVLSRVLREQGHWDEDLLECRTVETLDERTEVYQYVRNTMAPHPTRDHLVLRMWATELPKGACALVGTSVDHNGAALVGVRTNVLTSRYYMEPCGGGKTRLTHISRVDCRGRFPEWYNKQYGHIAAAEVARIRDSFTVPTDK